MQLCALLLLACCACRVKPDAESCRRVAEERRQNEGLSSAQVVHALGFEGICWKEGGYLLSYDCGDSSVDFEFDTTGACIGSRTVLALRTEVGAMPVLFTSHSRTPAFDSPSDARASRLSSWRAESIEPERRAVGNWHVSEGLRWLGNAARIEWRDDGLLLLAGCEDGSQIRLSFGRDGMMTGFWHALPVLIEN